MAEPPSLSPPAFSYADLHEVFRQYSDDLKASFERAGELNRQIASLYERLLLVGLGTFSLSVTAVTSLPGRNVVLAPSAKHLLVWLIASAWALLAISIIGCIVVINASLIGNSRFWAQSSGIANTYNYTMLSVHLGRFLTAVDADQHPDTTEQMNQQIAALKSRIAENEKTRRQLDDEIIGAKQPYLARSAQPALYLGLILLAIAAVKILFLL